jgi:hypothetical protein
MHGKYVFCGTGRGGETRDYMAVFVTISTTKKCTSVMLSPL